MSNSRLIWPTPEQLRRRYELMDRMMQKCGVTIGAAQGVDGGLALKEACAKCRYCLREEACRRWLTIRAPRTSPDFCPNTEFFLSCASAGLEFSLCEEREEDTQGRTDDGSCEVSMADV